MCKCVNQAFLYIRNLGAFRPTLFRLISLRGQIQRMDAPKTIVKSIQAIALVLDARKGISLSETSTNEAAFCSSLET